MLRSLRPEVLLGAAILLSIVVGCRGEGIGDPCIPEQVQSGGFDPSETTIENSSVQCLTRTCLVRGLDGDPTKVRGTPSCTDQDEAAGLCVDAVDVEQRVFCTCRCSADGDPNAPLCECPGGFVCEDDLVEIGDPGVRGGYCVPCRCPNDETNPLPAGDPPLGFPNCSPEYCESQGF